MDTQWQSLIGIAAVPSVLPVLVEHLKGAVRAARGIEGSPWPLLADTLAVSWAFALNDAGLLGDGLRVPTVVLAGLVAGAAASLGHDGWRRLTQPDGA